jgi:DNA polymerase III subunit delta'
LPEQVYPGSRPIADRLLGLIAAGRVDQPFLFVGPEGSGKEVTALDIARRCQCRRPAACRPGALCESCQKAVTFQHPDIRWLGPAPASLEDAAKADQVRQLLDAKVADPFHRSEAAASCQILIGNPDQPGPLTVRSLQQFLRRRTFQGRWKAAVVADANRLNPAAANALLKTLEEPPPSSLIMLLSSSFAGLPPTILSRCQQVPFPPYGEEEVLAILARLRPEASGERRAEAARCAGGDVRRALDLLTDESRRLRRWTEDLYADLCQARAGRLQIAAERLHSGTIDGDGNRNLEPVARRRQALRVCDHLSWLLAETVACRERGDIWRPRLEQAAARVRAAAARRPTGVLLEDIARVERAKREIDGNFNIGLVMAVLLQDLSEHVPAI